MLSDPCSFSCTLYHLTQSSGHDIGISFYSDFQAPAELSYLNTLLPGAGFASLMIIKQNPVMEPGPVLTYCRYSVMSCCC